MLSALSSSASPPVPPGSRFQSDEQFDQLYPPDIRSHAIRHWTPLSVVRKVIDFLTPRSNDRILDIGSGVGKFCLMAAHLKPAAQIIGIEQRSNLVALADDARITLGLPNVKFLHGNFTQLDFRQFDHFYFYNAFHENLVETGRIDEQIECSIQLYNYYNRQLFRKLTEMPSGTRLITYHCLDAKMPDDFLLLETQISDLLKYWIKA